MSTVKKTTLNYDEPSTSYSESKQNKTFRKYCFEYLQIGFLRNGEEEQPQTTTTMCYLWIYTCK